MRRIRTGIEDVEMDTDMKGMRNTGVRGERAEKATKNERPHNRAPSESPLAFAFRIPLTVFPTLLFPDLLHENTPYLLQLRQRDRSHLVDVRKADRCQWDEQTTPSTSR